MKVVGHRGARGLYPENTIEGFEKALKFDIDEIELDVRVTADGQAILHHDPALTDNAGNQLIIKQSSLSDLRQHKPDLALFADAVQTINRRVPIIVEVKPEEPTDQTVEVIKSFLRKGWQNHDFLLSSRSQPVLRQLHAALPDIEKVVIEYWSGVRAAKHAREVGARRLSMLEYWLWPGFIKGMARRGYQIYSFPPATPTKERRMGWFGLAGQTNDPKKARTWARAGLTGVITDFPDRYHKGA